PELKPHSRGVGGARDRKIRPPAGVHPCMGGAHAQGLDHAAATKKSRKSSLTPSQALRRIHTPHFVERVFAAKSFRVHRQCAYTVQRLVRRRLPPKSRQGSSAGQVGGE